MSNKEEADTRLVRQVNRLTTTLDRIEQRHQWSVYSHPVRFLWFSFLHGLMFVLGSTLGVAAVLYALGWLGYLPFLGSFFSDLQATITG